MSFVIDKQTLEDLNMLGKYKNNSIYVIYNKTITEGGEKVLEKMFRNPMNNSKAISDRSRIFDEFIKKPLDFPFDKKLIESVEFYMNTPVGNSKMADVVKLAGNKAMVYIAADENYLNLKKGLASLEQLLKQLRDLIAKLRTDYPSLTTKCDDADQLLEQLNVASFNLPEKAEDISFWKLEQLHYMTNVEKRDRVLKLLNFIYELDVYISVAKISAERHFNCAVLNESDSSYNGIRIKDLFHPAVRNAKSNSVEVDNDRNVIFLTGANMAGKSTFIKSFGVAIYLAHMGFPVPASEMFFNVRDGLYTSINVPDNLNMGYSHFYAEVLRVKYVAQEVADNKNLVIIFDELFKGTNVKDAYDATVAVVKAFSAHKKCNYIVSTHIIEAGEQLRKECSNFKYVYFPTVMQGNIPRYTYQLTEGITADRHGMMIINNEHIIDIIKGTN